MSQFFNNYYGRAYIYFGAPVMNNVADVAMTGETKLLSENSVSKAGDVNGDGYDDVISWSQYSGGRVIYFTVGAVMNNAADLL
ncbi:MAG: hypothetical protein IPI04_04330 [Ignavibacteria bacterium]|nr:hypothetical protein [Ignavibacteria bacterium]